MRRLLVLFALVAMLLTSACEAFDQGAGGPGSPNPSPIRSGPPSEEPTATPTAAPTPSPTPSPTPGAVLVANRKLSYTSSTSVGRSIELSVTVRNTGARAAGTITMEVEGIGFVLKSKAPLVGCVPDCKGATGAEGVAYLQWKGPAAGKARKYTAQLKAKAKGTFTFEIRLYEGKTGDYGDQLGRWTVKTRVR